MQGGSKKQEGGKRRMAGWRRTFWTRWRQRRKKRRLDGVGALVRERKGGLW
jgi:hypothetical protein